MLSRILLRLSAVSLLPKRKIFIARGGPRVKHTKHTHTITKRKGGGERERESRERHSSISTFVSRFSFLHLSLKVNCVRKRCLRYAARSVNSVPSGALISVLFTSVLHKPPWGSESSGVAQPPFCSLYACQTLCPQPPGSAVAKKGIAHERRGI